MKIPKKVFQQLGSAGGKARAANMTKQQLIEAARHAGKAKKNRKRK